MTPQLQQWSQTTTGMEELEPLEARLKELAIAAQQQPPKSLKRKRILAKLVRELIACDRLVKPKGDRRRKFYTEIYAEAKQRLFYHLCARLDDYDPNKGEVLQWANFLLEKRFFTEASRWIFQNIPSTVQRLTLDELEVQLNTKERPLTLESIYPEQTPLVSEQIIEWIKTDPERIFQTTHVHNHPAANFRFLALRAIEGYSWKETANQLGIKLVTLNSFYRRSLAKFAPKLQEYLLTQAIPTSKLL